MNSSTIAEQKIYKEIYKRAKILSKSSKCLICGKETSSMCNSHVVPAFILRGISENGHVAYGYSLFGEDAIYGTTGIHYPTFYSYCRFKHPFKGYGKLYFYKSKMNRTIFFMTM